MKKIYIVLTHSGTYFSQVIKFFTRYNYSHVAISFDKNINTMYSFGRKKYNNPLFGGFVIEKKDGLFYQKYNKTKCVVLEMKISNEKYKELKELVNEYKENQDLYKYDILGLAPRIVNIKIDRKYYKVCSEFVGSLLETTHIYNFEMSVIKPIDFMNIPNKRIIYEGSLVNY